MNREKEEHLEKQVAILKTRLEEVKKKLPWTRKKILLQKMMI